MILICDKDGVRLDAYLAEKLDASRAYVKKMFDEEKLLVNGKAPKASLKVKLGDEISYELPEIKELNAEPQDIPLDIVYEDDHLLVINKPVGMVVHPAPGNPDNTLVNAVMSHCSGRLSTINSVIRPGIVHRIDKDTSGLLVVAKTDEAHQGLADQFAVHSITRVYTAIVNGHFKTGQGMVDAPIGRHGGDRKKMAVTAKNSKRAVTHFEVIEEFDGYSLVKCKLETGRTHQIRVHMSYTGHPLLGDSIYGDKNKLGINHQMLHAGVLGFEHPITKEYIEFERDIPEKFQEIINKLRGK